MKKSIGRRNWLAEYRRLMREIRTIFDPFTARYCRDCVTPCCRRPSRLAPFDVSLALSCGHKFPGMSDDMAHKTAVGYASQLLIISADQEEDQPCDMLVGSRCTFPDDIRPFGCTTYICPPMYEHLPNMDLRKLKRLARLLAEAHEQLVRAAEV